MVPRISEEDINAAKEGLQIINENMDLVLSELAPEVFNMLDKINPVFEMVMSKLFESKTMDRAFVMGTASRMATELLKNGMEPTLAATVAVTCAKQITELSRK